MIPHWTRFNWTRLSGQTHDNNLLTDRRGCSRCGWCLSAPVSQRWPSWSPPGPDWALWSAAGSPAQPSGGAPSMPGTLSGRCPPHLLQRGRGGGEKEGERLLKVFSTLKTGDKLQHVISIGKWKIFLNMSHHRTCFLCPEAVFILGN